MRNRFVETNTRKKSQQKNALLKLCSTEFLLSRNKATITKMCL